MVSVGNMRIVFLLIEKKIGRIFKWLLYGDGCLRYFLKWESWIIEK